MKARENDRLPPKDTLRLPKKKEKLSLSFSFKCFGFGHSWLLLHGRQEPLPYQCTRDSVSEPSQLWDAGRHQMTPGGIKTNPFWYKSSKSFSRTMCTVPESHGTQKVRYGSKARAPGSFWETKELGVSSSTFLSWANPRRWLPTKYKDSRFWDQETWKASEKASQHLSQ